MTRLALCAAMLFAAPALAQAPAQAQAQAPVGSMNSLDLQNARADALKTKGQRRAYTRAFDLSGLPEYTPLPPMRGTIRQWGSNYLADSPLEGYLEDAFRKYHPDVQFENNLTSTFIGMAGLYTGQADLAPMGRRPSWEELQAYQRMMGALPAEVMMATGSFDVSGWTFALVPFVHKDNPIRQLTLEQLDGIFGARRDGGWKLNSWDAGAARGSDKDIRTWGQLGLKGEWADKPIRVLGYTLNFHFPRDFAEKVMGGGYRWNEQLVEYSNKVREGEGEFGRLWTAGDQMMEDLARDKYAITYTSMLFANAPNAKTVPLAKTAAGPFVMPTLETVQARTYPLVREVYYYANRKPGEKMDPVVAEYLRFVTSREGQALIMKDGKYLPMTAEAARAQREEIERLGSASTGEGG